jgi:hypothetical protein
MDENEASWKSGTKNQSPLVVLLPFWTGAFINKVWHVY